MSKSIIRLRRWLAVTILAHLAVSIVHGSVHTAAQIALSPSATVFVFGVILIGPLVGVALTWPAKQPGSRIVVMTMAGSFVFGVLNHFVLASPDRVDQVPAPSQLLFTITAIALALTELTGLILAIRLARAKP